MSVLPRSRAARTLLALVAVLLLCVLLWVGLSLLLATDRGVDFTDEGLYLLSADPPVPGATWWIPFGWHTQPLFALVGYDIASFRTAGAVLLVGAAFAAGYLLSVLSESFAGDGTSASGVGGRSLLVGGGAAVASLAFYSWFIRTPGYDWLNLVGMLIALSGFFLHLSAVSEAPGGRRRWVSGLGLGIAVLGAFATVPGRPTTWFVLTTATTLVVWHWQGARRAARFVAAWVAGTVVLGVACVAAGIWPRDLLGVVSYLRNYVPFHSSQTPSGAVAGVLQMPMTFARETWLTPQWLKYPMLVLLVVLVVLAWQRRSPKAVLGVVTGLGVLLVLTLRSTWFWDLNVQATTASIWLLLVMMVFALAVRRNPTGYGCPADGARPMLLPRSVSVSLMLLVLVVVYGFGSTNGPYAMAAKPFVLVYLLVAAVALGIGCRRAIVAALVGLTVVTSGISARMVANGYQHPLNVRGSIADQVVESQVGSRGSRLLLDRETAAYVAALNEFRTGPCWSEGTRLLGLEWQWTTTDSYVLGAQAPSTLMLTILYPNEQSLKNLDLSLSRLDGPQWRDSWLALSDPASIPPEGTTVVDRAVTSLTTHLGRSFPEDYRLVGKAGGTELWAPLGAPLPKECAAGAP